MTVNIKAKFSLLLYELLCFVTVIPL